MKKLTKTDLKRIIKEEAAKFGKEKDVEEVHADEVDADELAGTLDKKVDYVKALNIKERKLMNQLKKIRESKLKIISSL